MDKTKYTELQREIDQLMYQYQQESQMISQDEEKSEKLEVAEQLTLCENIEKRYVAQFELMLQIEEKIHSFEQLANTNHYANSSAHHKFIASASANNICTFVAATKTHEAQSDPTQPYSEVQDYDRNQQTYVKNVKRIVPLVNQWTTNKLDKKISGEISGNTFIRYSFTHVIEVSDEDHIDNRLSELFDYRNPLVRAIMSKMMNKLVSNFGFVDRAEVARPAISWLIENDCIKHYCKLIGDAMGQPINEEVETEAKLQLCAKAFLKTLQNEQIVVK